VVVTVEPHAFPESKALKSSDEKSSEEELRQEDFTLRTLEASAETMPLNNNVEEESKV
jgi:hypothetical protein